MTTPKCMVCTCEDVTDTELREAIGKGDADLESLKRYTGFATGPCQGKACVVLARRILAEATGADEAALGAITYRPPVVPVPLGDLAGEEVDER
ncbi:MAG TPA: (2Fe-2S)-binding protein [Candidatus Thermoplasmatota archaeon]|nr:(2Fe-2S)-binding protein [Candidatus Thermoplasmatota archaeon]